MTINKAQVQQTFEKVGIYLSYPAFCHGQLYVTRAMAAVKVKVLETNQQEIRGGNTVTPNIIYQDVL